MIHDVATSDFQELLRLNLESEHFLSPLDESRLAWLHQQAVYHRAIGINQELHAFLLVFGAKADYDSPNYQWFDQRYTDFLYVDRVVVDTRHHRKGLGQLLYDDLFQFAKQKGVSAIACEYDMEPPNESSQRFHERFGFQQVGLQSVQGGKKQVSLQLVRLN